MSKMIKFLVIGVVLFSGAAGASWYFQSQHEDDPSAKTADDKHGANSKSHAPTPTSTPNAKGEKSEPRPLTRPSPSPEADRLAKTAGALQQQQEALKAREQQLFVREKQLDTIHDEIKLEHKKLESVRKEIEGELAVLQEKLELFEKRKVAVDRVKSEADALVGELSDLKKRAIPGETKNIKQAAGIFDRMEPDAGAENIQRLIEKGEMDYAVGIIVNMRETRAAALLSELGKQESGTAADIMKRIQRYKVLDGATK